MTSDNASRSSEPAASGIRPRRSSCAPAYYLGRSAEIWLAAVNKRASFVYRDFPVATVPIRRLGCDRTPAPVQPHFALNLAGVGGCRQTRRRERVRMRKRTSMNRAATASLDTSRCPSVANSPGGNERPSATRPQGRRRSGRCRTRATRRTRTARQPHLAGVDSEDLVGARHDRASSFVPEPYSTSRRYC